MGARSVLAWPGSAAVAATICACSSTSGPPPSLIHPPTDAGAEVAPTGTVIARLPSPSHLVTDGRYVYMTAGGGVCGADGEVVRLPLDGGEPVIIATSSSPWGVAIDDTWVYWADQASNDAGRVTGKGTVERVAKTGGTAQTVATSPAPAEIVVDDTNVYWTDDYYGKNTIWSASKTPGDAGAGSATLLASPDAGLVGGVALDAAHFYWVELDDIPDGALRRIPKRGGAIETLTTGTMSYQFAAFDDGGVYAGISEGYGSPGGVLRYDTASGQMRLLGEGDFFPIGIAVEQGYVYWTDDFGVFSASLDGGVAALLASSVANAFPMGIVVTNGTAYWAGSGEGTVRSIAVPAGR